MRISLLITKTSIVVHNERPDPDFFIMKDLTLIFLASGLSGVAVAGIALGAVAACALVAGGAYVYHRYNRSDNSEGKEPVSPKDSEPS